MLRSLTTAATGMLAQQLNIDVISNNLANVNTTGYKKVRAEFQDLLSQTIKPAGAQIFQGTIQPVGIEIGLGTKTSATMKEFSEGALKPTGGSLDVAIEGDGFFQVMMDDGSTAYTRDGSFKIDANGQLTTSDGFIIQPQVTISNEATDIIITPDGSVFEKTAGVPEPGNVGTLNIVKFANPAGLSPLGRNLYEETAASGNPIEAQPGQEGLGALQQGFLEGSNVQVVEELINLIQAERAFEANSKLVRSSDNLLQILNRMS